MHADGTKAYVLGFELYRMAKQFSWIEFLTQHASEILRKLAKETNETVHLAVRKGQKTIIVDNIASNQLLNVSFNVGTKGLLHWTSLGKALIMDHTDEELEQLFGAGPLKAATARTLKTTYELMSDLARCRKRGNTLDIEEYHKGIRCVGAPIRDDKYHIVAAVGISAPSYRLTAEKYEDMGELIKRATSSIEDKLRVSAGMDSANEIP